MTEWTNIGAGRRTIAATRTAAHDRHERIKMRYDHIADMAQSRWFCLDAINGVGFLLVALRLH